MIFISGIHGVGKTSLCKEISRKFGIPHFSAGQLISEVKREHFSRNKLIENIDANQDFLTQALENLNIGNSWFLLDGHFCLLNKEGVVTSIPEKTFQNLNPQGIMVLTDSAKLIAERLIQRDNIHFNTNLLEVFQINEVDYATRVSEILNIPFLSSKIGEQDQIDNFIGQLIGDVR